MGWLIEFPLLKGNGPEKNEWVKFDCEIKLNVFISSSSWLPSFVFELRGYGRWHRQRCREGEDKQEEQSTKQFIMNGIKLMNESNQWN